ncbi:MULTISPECIES: outer membrane lipoprotein-sorting protein [unclassified Sphaerochaeta]|uniref:outer membrane lipoprotein-sorting protein n=1 Tax=unclassified Sphaerochaeta TaxID=2637943 RepID=UPI0025D7B63E|nr:MULTISPECIES: outer membrane lipoprotein-sorting protein [unclassified Sphaerochaeta]
MKRTITTLILLLLASSLVWAAMPADQVMAKVMEVQTSDSSALDLKLTLIEPNGQMRERRIQTLSQTKNGLTSSLTVFLSPENVRNTRFLSIEQEGGTNEQWIYLPALKRSRRIGSSEEGGSFMGSDFSYADMASTTYDEKEAEHLLLAEDQTSWRIQSTPFEQKTYGKTITVVQKATYLPLRVEFYDLDGNTLVKTLVTEETGTANGKPITKILTMKTEAGGHATRLEILQARFDAPLSSGYFTLKFLETGRL